jgi:hypothetical protein
MAPTPTHKKSRSAAAHMKASKNRDKENADLKRKLTQYEAQEEKKTPKKPPKDRNIPPLAGTIVLRKDEVSKDEKDAITKSINFHTFSSTIFLHAGGGLGQFGPK